MFLQVVKHTCWTSHLLVHIPESHVPGTQDYSDAKKKFEFKNKINLIKNKEKTVSIRHLSGIQT